MGRSTPVHKKATVQAAIVTGVAVIIGSILGALALSWFSPKSTPVKTELVSASYQKPTPVETYEDPSISGLTIISDFRTIDLRRAFIVPPSEKNKKEMSPVTMIRHTLVRKIEPTAHLEYEAATRGHSVQIRCISHNKPGQCEIVYATGPVIYGSLHLDKTYKLKVKLGPNDSGLILIVTEATYWNNLNDPSGDFWSATTIPTTESLSMAILFAPGHSFKTIKYSFGPRRASSGFESFQGDLRIAGGTKEEYAFWEIRNPQEGYSYLLEWTWDWKM